MMKRRGIIILLVILAAIGIYKQEEIASLLNVDNEPEICEVCEGECPCPEVDCDCDDDCTCPKCA